MTDLLKLPTFAAEDVFHVVVESPRGSSVKLKYDPDLGAITFSRPLVLGLAYPYDWGFVPSTNGPDGDPVDALVLSDVATFPGVVIACRAIAVLQIEQNHPSRSGERVRNDRVLAIPAKQRRLDMDSLQKLTAQVRDEIMHFLVATTAFEGKDVKVLGWGDAAAALALIREAG
jgi:inorganic pyrophosphatase